MRVVGAVLLAVLVGVLVAVAMLFAFLPEAGPPVECELDLPDFGGPGLACEACGGCEIGIPHRCADVPQRDLQSRDSCGLLEDTARRGKFRTRSRLSKLPASVAGDEAPVSPSASTGSVGRFAAVVPI